MNTGTRPRLPSSPNPSSFVMVLIELSAFAKKINGARRKVPRPPPTDTAISFSEDLAVRGATATP